MLSLYEVMINLASSIFQSQIINDINFLNNRKIRMKVPVSKADGIANWRKLAVDEACYISLRGVPKIAAFRVSDPMNG